MVAHEKSIWFGCMLAASLFVLVLAGCGEDSESGSSQMAQPSKKSPPTETAESQAAGGGPANCRPTQPDIAPEYRTVVASERLEPVDTDIPGEMKVIPTNTFEEVPHPFALVVPGGATIKAMRDEAIRSYVRTAAETAEVVGSVCTGALTLASVSLLEGRQATTHWAFYKVLEQFGAKYLRKRWVEDGKFICSAGVSAGIDMALRLADRLTDEQTAREVQYRLDYDPEPPFGGIDYEHIGGRFGAWRAGLSLAAPMIAAKPKRLTRLAR